MKAPVADLLLPEDLQRGCIVEAKPGASVLDRLLQAVQKWEADGGEAQVRFRGQYPGQSQSAVGAECC